MCRSRVKKSSGQERCSRPVVRTSLSVGPQGCIAGHVRWQLPQRMQWLWHDVADAVLPTDTAAFVAADTLLPVDAAACRANAFPLRAQNSGGTAAAARRRSVRSLLWGSGRLPAPRGCPSTNRSPPPTDSSRRSRELRRADIAHLAARRDRDGEQRRYPPMPVSATNGRVPCMAHGAADRHLP